MHSVRRQSTLYRITNTFMNVCSASFGLFILLEFLIKDPLDSGASLKTTFDR